MMRQLWLVQPKDLLSCQSRIRTSMTLSLNGLENQVTSKIQALFILLQKSVFSKKWCLDWSEKTKTDSDHWQQSSLADTNAGEHNFRLDVQWWCPFYCWCGLHVGSKDIGKGLLLFEAKLKLWAQGWRLFENQRIHLSMERCIIIKLQYYKL